MCPTTLFYDVITHKRFYGPLTHTHIDIYTKRPLGTDFMTIKLYIGLHVDTQGKLIKVIKLGDIRIK